jgi:hypothetical protein
MDIQLDPAFINSMSGGFMVYLVLILNFLLLFVVGYLVGYVVSNALRKVLSIPHLVKSAVSYGVMTSKLWDSISSFLSQYMKWFITVLVLSTSGIPLFNSIAEFMVSLLWFILLTVVGLAIGGIFFKVIKEALIHVGVEEQMKRHRVEDAFGGLTLSGIVAGLAKLYIVLLFMAEGTLKLNLPILTFFISDVLAYIPEALSGVVILMVALLIARFASESIRSRRINFAEILALCVEAVVVFFGIVISLPILVKSADVSILTDSFKILIAGIAVGSAIALGLGLKDSIADLSTRYEKKM